MCVASSIYHCARSQRATNVHSVHEEMIYRAFSKQVYSLGLMACRELNPSASRAISHDSVFTPEEPKEAVLDQTMSQENVSDKVRNLQVLNRNPDTHYCNHYPGVFSNKEFYFVYLLVMNTV